MKLVDKYYEKVYKQTQKVTKKLFGKDVVGCMALRFQLKNEIETAIQKPIKEITSEDIIQHKLSYTYAKYRTLFKILEVLESACTLKTFTVEELEYECK